VNLLNTLRLPALHYFDCCYHFTLELFLVTLVFLLLCFMNSNLNKKFILRLVNLRYRNCISLARSSVHGQFNVFLQVKSLKEIPWSTEEQWSNVLLRTVT
jgi:hypothetical protein